MANPLFVRKSIDKLIEQSDSAHNNLKRTLGPVNLVLLGIGAVIGAGLFVRTAAAAAEHAGPSVIISYVLAGIGCAFAGLCYSEFASTIPIAGSAYTYSYATLGEFIAWIIGWDLILEYAVGAATVSIAWSEYLNRLLGIFHSGIPYQWCHSPFEVSAAGVHGIMNIPAVFILLLLSLLLIRGTQESAMVNAIIVILKVSIVLLVIGFGWSYIVPANHQPLIPEVGTYTDPSTGITTNFGGILGILGGAGVVFFAYIGFDAVSTAAQETKNPKRDMPIGILVSLLVCTILYILFAYVLTGIAPYKDFRIQGHEASVAYAISTYMHKEWLANLITVAILAGFSSVILVMLLGQSRVFFSMSHDGLVPKVFSDVHPKFRTPWKSNLIFFVFVGLFAAFIPIGVTGNMTSIGTLFAFVLVCIGVWVMRVRRPELQRGFRTPLVPLVPILGIAACCLMIYGLGWTNWLRLIIWLILGLVIYFTYSIKNSVARKDAEANS